MKKMKKSTAYTVQSALIAALYAALTYAVSPIAYGSMQFRVSEALTVLPVFTPAAIPGLAIGCVLANIGSPFGPIDIVVGTIATILAAVATRLTRNIKFKKIPILSLLFPAIFNAVIIGAEITLMTPEESGFVAFLASAGSVGIGELVVCFTLGILLFLGIERTKIYKKNGD